MTKLSVIIPTYGRAQWLGQAILSCLEIGLDAEDVEVLVCVNGILPESIVELVPWRDHSSVRILHTPRQGANPARNLGLREALGTYVIFLDDDDYLDSDGVRKQLRRLDLSGADACSGIAIAVDAQGRELRRYVQPEGLDFASAVLSDRILALNFTHCLRRDSLDGLTWDEECPVAHDHVVLYRWLALRDVAWTVIDQPVGSWRCHEAQRQSGVEDGYAVMRAYVDGIMKTSEVMLRQSRLTLSGRRAAAEGLWLSLHPIFDLDVDWSLRVARYALALDPKSRPRIGRPLFQWFFDRSPLISEIGFGFLRRALRR